MMTDASPDFIRTSESDRRTSRQLLLLLFLLFCILRSACAFAEGDISPLLVDDAMEYATHVDDIIAGMSLHEKVCQLFFVQPEQFSLQERVNVPNRRFYAAFSRFPVGGVILFAPNIRKSTVADLNAGMQEAAVSAGGISGTINSTPAWIALTEQQGATFTYTVTDLVATGTATVSVPVAIFPLDLFQSGASVGAAFGGVAVGGLVRSFLPLAAQLPVVTEDTNASSTLDSRSGIVTRAHYNGAQTFTIPTGTSSGWYAIIVRSRDNSTTFTCGGSDGLIIAGASSIPTTKTISGLGTYILIRVAGTRLALFYDQNSGGGGGGGSTDWSDLTNVPLVTTISSASTDSQFPSAKCVYDQIGDIETLLQALR